MGCRRSRLDNDYVFQTRLPTSWRLYAANVTVYIYEVHLDCVLVNLPIYPRARVDGGPIYVFIETHTFSPCFYLTVPTIPYNMLSILKPTTRGKTLFFPLPPRSACGLPPNTVVPTP